MGMRGGACATLEYPKTAQLAKVLEEDEEELAA
jgi:hypothetical protein